MPCPVPFDWKNPDYLSVIQWRIDKLKWIRANPQYLPAIKEYYKENIGQFIIDWGVTTDPRNADIGLQVKIPFILFPRQEEWVVWLIDNWRNRKKGITEKSRDMGMSWLSVAVACSICLFYDDITIGFGSRKEEYVDKNGAPKSLFWKAREFIRHLPPEFRGGWDKKRDSAHMRISFPETNSVMTGEAGDGIGRGDRAAIYFVDEASFLERPQLVDASLSMTTNCRQDISTPNGLANSFALRRHSGKIPVFTFHWRDDPRKDDAWYAKMCYELDPVTVAQEIDLSYSASVERVLIPALWVEAAINAHVKLGFEASGSRVGAFDVADCGKDMNAWGYRHGVVMRHCESWSGKGDDIYGSVERVFALCDEHEVKETYYDSDGLGAGVRGDSRKINEGRRLEALQEVIFEAYRGSAKVHDPEGEMVKDRTNQDFFMNYKAQAWWSLRTRFQKTYRAVVEGMIYHEDELISIPSDLPELDRLKNELSQPTYDRNTAGKVFVDKQPDGMPSPNHADMVCMLYSPAGMTMSVWERMADY